MSTCAQGPIPGEGTPAWKDSGLLAGVLPPWPPYQQALGLEPLCGHTHVCMFNIPGGGAASAELLAWAVQVISLGANYSLGEFSGYKVT